MSSALPAREQGIQAEPAGTAHEEKHEPADDREILEELN
jgi:hypothetical protein